MLGILMVAAGEILSEIGVSIGKYEVAHKKESLYAMGFLNAVWSTIFLLLIALLWRGEFIFSLESLPTFTIRAVLELILLFVSLHAVLSAERSTFTFLRIITIPLLLGVDLILGYSISLTQITGISIIVVALILLFLNHGLGKRGKLLSLISALMAVGTISLYKYNVTHFNSVEAEQSLMHIILLIALLVAAKWRTGENLFNYLKHRVFLIQSLVSGFASVFISFSFLFAPASIITTGKRSFGILTSMVSGQTYFHEKHIILKVVVLILILSGTILIVY